MPESVPDPTAENKNRKKYEPSFEEALENCTIIKGNLVLATSFWKG